jgi:hypothetical protein
MNGALAYDMFENEYTDAQNVVPAVRVRSKHFSEHEDSTPGAYAQSPVLVLAVKEISNRDYKITLRNAIAVHLEGEHGQHIALHEESRICGQGPDAPAAVRDFEDSFISVYLSYRDSKDPLSPGAKEYVQSLRNLIAHIEEV